MPQIKTETKRKKKKKGHTKVLGGIRREMANKRQG